MFKEEFPPIPELRLSLIEAAQQLDTLKNERVVDTLLDQDGMATITFESGKRLTFNIADEDHTRVDNLSIE